MDLSDILAENRRRNALADAPFDPVSGLNAPGQRFRYGNPLLFPPVQYLPVTMREEPVLRRLEEEPSPAPSLVNLFFRVRAKHDFPFWAATLVKIKNKDGGPDMDFRLNRPQRKFVELLESMRVAGEPIRVVMLKARQWGGSTCCQLYMAWLQLMRRTGLNSLIVAHQGTASDEIKDMYDRMIADYPVELLYPPGELPERPGRKMVRVGKSGSIFRIPGRNCKLKIGTAERPDSTRGADSSLVHLSEVGLWKSTPSRAAEDVVRSCCAGILYRPGTMIVYESTANGTGNFFCNEYRAAVKGKSQFRPIFISWFEIEKYSLPFAPGEEEAFAAGLLRFRCEEVPPDDRAEPGSYLWWLWEKGATLEGIHWYVNERRKYSSHGQMAAEYPSDDVEAFVHSGALVFDKYHLDRLRPGCSDPRWRGDVDGAMDTGPMALLDVCFHEGESGCMKIWEMPERGERWHDRYLAVMDVGGRSAKADWSVVAVFDRAPLLSGNPPEVVAQWRGHCDMDLLAWKGAQIASFYNDALLVIESNTLETHYRMDEGNQSAYILTELRDSYPNLYARSRSPEDIREGAPVRYGFHTNTSTKGMIISNLVRMVRDAGYVERDEEALDEMLNYEKRSNGSYGAIPGHHDDLLMTRAIGLFISAAEMPVPRRYARDMSRPGRSGAFCRGGFASGASRRDPFGAF